VHESDIVVRESVRDLIARYNTNGDSGRYEEVAELFAPDAVVTSAGRTFTGRDGVRQLFGSAGASMVQLTEVPIMRHFTSSHQIDVVSASAARSYCYFQAFVGSRGLDHWGRYIDEFGSVDGDLLFTARRIIIDGRIPGGWADQRELG
jgi:hypothetical protein